MNCFYIISNPDKDPEETATTRIRSYLEDHGKQVYVSRAYTRNRADYRYTNAHNIPHEVECVLVLGGDGTLLQAARDLHEREIPLLGINLGTLGYLAEVEIASVENALDALMDDSYTVEERMMLDGKIVRENREIMHDTAMNDIVIVRTGPLRIIDFDVYVNNSFLCSLRSDGVIVSTPTGSTGYNLSAGGPIVSPGASMMVLTAIAPHTLAFRPVVLPDHVEISVVMRQRARKTVGSADTTFDGDTSMGIGVGDRVSITRSERKVKLIKIHNTSFVEILRRKMN